MSPFLLDILLHYYLTRDEPYVNIDAPAYPEAEQKLVEEGALIRPGDQGVPPQITRLGSAWVRAILSTPKPRHVFFRC